MWICKLFFHPLICSERQKHCEKKHIHRILRKRIFLELISKDRTLSLKVIGNSSFHRAHLIAWMFFKEWSTNTTPFWIYKTPCLICCLRLVFGFLKFNQKTKLCPLPPLAFCKNSQFCHKHAFAALSKRGLKICTNQNI